MPTSPTSRITAYARSARRWDQYAGGNSSISFQPTLEEWHERRQLLYISARPHLRLPHASRVWSGRLSAPVRPCLPKRGASPRAADEDALPERGAGRWAARRPESRVVLPLGHGFGRRCAALNCYNGIAVVQMGAGSELQSPANSGTVWRKKGVLSGRGCSAHRNNLRSQAHPCAAEVPSSVFHIYKLMVCLMLMKASLTSAPPALLRPAPSTPPPNAAHPAVVDCSPFRHALHIFKGFRKGRKNGTD
ncbi:hypothetical protein B0H17DRAFT_1127634 [Mycena rosella]|uniref:Uncharacterized protein n=1 Tax=Mycena rosella TaxID=1033263 RepID=A0AAD7E0V3_MYCRO|nr:hypothetical protein B0H17DRAFT_1127634 [Mycena rosella]